MNIGHGLFIAGTDTGVGKTVAASFIASGLSQRGFNVGVMKPFQTGAVQTLDGWEAPDALFLKRVSGVSDDISLICPVMLEAPLAPSVASAIEGKTVGIADILPAYHALRESHKFLVVEAAGGLAVPINGKETMRELAKALSLPVLIVARPSLGTINHTQLTVQYAHSANLTIAGIVISNYPDTPNLAEKTNPKAIEDLTGLPVLGILGHDPLIDTENYNPGNIVSNAALHPLIDRLISRLVEITAFS